MMGNNANYTRISACALGFAFGMTNGLAMMFLAFLAWKAGIGGGVVTMMANMYHGYGANLPGALLGFGWGFLDGFVFGVLAGFFYNLCLCCCCCKRKEL